MTRPPLHRPTLGARTRVWATLIVTATAACGGEDTPSVETEAPPVPVRVTEVELSTAAEVVRGSGTLAAETDVLLAFRIPGYVEDVLVREGDRVAEGQILARLQMTEAAAQLRSAEAQADLAAKQLDRMERLVADSVVPEVQLDQARDGYERAQAGVDLARFSLENATIRAPSAGRVLTRMAERSGFVQAGTPAFRFGGTEEGWVARIAVSDRDVVRLRRGAAAHVRVDALDGAELPGTVSEISDAADPASGTFLVEVTLDAGIAAGMESRLRTGVVVQVEIPLDAGPELAYLPTQAVVDAEGDRGAVFVVESGRATRLNVRIGRITDGAVGVDAPELAGATVVTDGAAYLIDGALVDDRTQDR